MAKTSFLTPDAQKTVLPKASALIAWYRKHARDLPWRSHFGRAPSPYHTWVSEIMLQQTTVATVIPYYERFIVRWPNVSALAKAKDEEVLGAWAGLGYYRRARMLHACAKVVAKDYKGAFPSDITELKKLPGIGDYTANAIEAIAFDKPANVVDGNVERVVSRIFAFDQPINIPANKKHLRHLAEKLLPKKDFGAYAQGLMDLGATICTPRKPACPQCPWRKECKALALGKPEAFPVIQRAKKIPKRFAVAFATFNKEGQILLQQRPVNGLLGGLWEIPSTQWRDDHPWGQQEILGHSAYKKFKPEMLHEDIVHIFTHFKLTTRLYKVTLPLQAHKLFPDAQWFASDNLPPLSTLTKKLIRAATASL